MKIAITSDGTSLNSNVDPRFGRTQYFVFYNTETNETGSFDNSDSKNEAHGAGPKAAAILFDNGIQVLITGNGPGGNAATVIEKAGIEVFVGAAGMTVEQAVNAYKNNELKKF